jgi:hypothetical protein
MSVANLIENAGWLNQLLTFGPLVLMVIFGVCLVYFGALKVVGYLYIIPSDGSQPSRIKVRSRLKVAGLLQEAGTPGPQFNVDGLAPNGKRYEGSLWVYAWRAIRTGNDHVYKGQFIFSKTPLEGEGTGELANLKLIEG